MSERGGGADSAVWGALGTVRDPELDEPITTLGFVASCTVSSPGRAQIRLRLPTYFCAPNFAFLMVADAYDAVTALPGVRSAEVILDDHFASDAINAGVAARAGFVASFEGEAAEELDRTRGHPSPPPPRGPHPYRDRGQHVHLLRHAPRPLSARVWIETPGGFREGRTTPQVSLRTRR